MKDLISIAVMGVLILFLVDYCVKMDKFNKQFRDEVEQQQKENKARSEFNY